MNSQQRFVTRIAFKTLMVLVSLVCVTGAISIRTSRASAIFTVTNTNDSGLGSLRQAILNANTFKGVDLINFNIPGRGVHTIRPVFPLPIVKETVLIDGWSQGGSAYAGPPLIEISGVNMTQANIPALRIGCFWDCEGTEFHRVDSSNVRGLIINGFPGSPNAGLTQADGIHIVGSNNKVRGCYIGTTADGEAALPNAGSGIRVDFYGDNDIGDTNPEARNVISGNLQDGVVINGAVNNRIRGNYIGLSASGVSDLGNGAHGIEIESSNNVIGGNSTGARNVISGNAFDGILIGDSSGAEFVDNRIEGNYIGTKADGVSGAGNGRWGINATGLVGDTQIGGLTSQFGNVISGNGSGRGEGGGIQLIGLPGFIVQSNLIGVGADRTTNLGNFGDGIVVNAQGARIGGSFTYFGHTFSAGNVIAFNQGLGIKVEGNEFTNGNLISRNSLYQNGGLGIDLEPLGVTVDDLCDFDTGPNDLQNAPNITSIVPGLGGGIRITGSVNGPSPNYTVEFFDNDDCDSSGHGEGRRFLGSTVTTVTLPLCAQSFQVTFPNISMRQLRFVTATATNPEGSTSEFSPCFSTD